MHVALEEKKIQKEKEELQLMQSLMQIQRIKQQKAMLARKKKIELAQQQRSKGQETQLENRKKMGQGREANKQLEHIQDAKKTEEVTAELGTCKNLQN